MQGFQTSDDAAVWAINDEVAAVLTLDFFTPVVDDPYEFGAIAAANALSDIFAMGATPVAALNILAFPCSLGPEVVAEVIRGGSEKVAEAGAFVVGGHSIDDKEPKYGLSVMGTIHPDKVLKNEGAKPGDILYTTKRIGTGMYTSAFRSGLIDDEGMRPAIESMMELNKNGAEAMRGLRVHAATDITGFGLAGHLHEMLEPSGVSAVIDFDALPVFDGIYQYSRDYVRPGKTASIIEWSSDFVKRGTLDEDAWNMRMGVLCDPQTSGGLLISIHPEDAAAFEAAFEQKCGRAPWKIGVVEDGPAGVIMMS